MKLECNHLFSPIILYECSQNYINGNFNSYKLYSSNQNIFSYDRVVWSINYYFVLVIKC